MGSPICVARLRITNAAGYFDSLNPDPLGVQPRIRFTVTRSLRSEPNTAQIQFYNPAPLTAALIIGVVRSRTDWTATERAQLFELGKSGATIEMISEIYGLGSVELSWGFTDSEAPNMLAALSVGFIGQSSKMRYAPDGRDQVLTIEVQDGAHLLGAGEAIQSAGAGVVPFVGKSYKPGTNVVDVIMDLIAACGLTADRARLLQQLQAAMIAKNLPPADLKLLGGYNASGPARPQVQQIMDALQLRWSVQNGELLFLDSTSVLTGFPPIELSSAAGNIFGEPEAVDAFKMAVRTWAQPGAAPGRAVTMITPTRTANYRIEVATTTVDTNSGGETRLELDELQTIPGVF
jgi:hypothetical protein